MMPLLAIWAVIRAWHGWRMGAGALAGAMAWLWRDVWRLVAVIAALAWLRAAIIIHGMHLRLPGPIPITLIHQPGLLAELAEARATIQAMKNASNQATAVAAALNASVAAHYRADAEKADAHYKTLRAASRDAVDRYIAAHQLRASADPGGAGGADTPAQAGDPGLSAALPAAAVVVSADDVHACTGAADYALAAHDAAMRAIADGTGVPAPEGGGR